MIHYIYIIIPQWTTCEHVFIKFLINIDIGILSITGAWIVTRHFHRRCSCVYSNCLGHNFNYWHCCLLQVSYCFILAPRSEFIDLKAEVIIITFVVFYRLYFSSMPRHRLKAKHKQVVDVR